MHPPAVQAALASLTKVGGDEFVHRLVRTFVEFADRQMAEMRHAVELHDVAEAARVAHALKSSAAQLGAEAMGAACAAVERAGRAGDRDGTVNALMEVESAWAEARSWFDGGGG